MIFILVLCNIRKCDRYKKRLSQFYSITIFSKIYSFRKTTKILKFDYIPIYII